MSESYEVEFEGRTLRLRAESFPGKRKLELADDTTSADRAFGRLCEGAALWYRSGDFHNARQLLSALGRRVEQRRKKAPSELSEAFRAHRQHQGYAHRVLAGVWVELDGEHRLSLARAPDVAAAVTAALGAPDGKPTLVPLRELLGYVGAYEWQKKGIALDEVGGVIVPHYGVWAPVRSEYVALVAKAPLAAATALDLGTGTGVLAIVLAKRGVKSVLASDVEPRAVACAAENVQRLGVADRVRVVQSDLFPEGRWDLVVFNPPWVPEKPRSIIERGVYDEGGATLKRFLEALGGHLAPNGEGWLILSDLPERLGLRAAGELEALFAAAGLKVRGTLQTTPTHKKARDEDDPLHAARVGEVTRLYRLGAGAD
jgi:SAM-dependent methyltransferase